MPKSAAYDLMVLLDPELPEERHTQILDGIRKQLKAGKAELKHDVAWGSRRMAYEINHRTEAVYHLFQLEAESELLDQLRQSLSIEDGVLRFRIIRLEEGVPATPPQPSAPRQAPRPQVSEEASRPQVSEEATTEPSAADQPA